MNKNQFQSHIMESISMLEKMKDVVTNVLKEKEDEVNNLETRISELKSNADIIINEKQLAEEFKKDEIAFNKKHFDAMKSEIEKLKKVYNG